MDYYIGYLDLFDAGALTVLCLGAAVFTALHRMRHEISRNARLLHKRAARFARHRAGG